MNSYGKELILDLTACNSTRFTKECINEYFVELCKLINMERVQQHWWVDDKATESHLRGVSAVQFIKTSNITIHAIELMQNVYINVFSCKDFDCDSVIEFSKSWFDGMVVRSSEIIRR